MAAPSSRAPPPSFDKGKEKMVVMINAKKRKGSFVAKGDSLRKSGHVTKASTGSVLVSNKPIELDPTVLTSLPLTNLYERDYDAKKLVANL